MINSKHRFHGFASLRFVYSRGKTVRGPWFAVKTIANSRRTHYRMAVVVSRKVNKSAVVRNKIRRRIYEATRSLEPTINTSQDIVVTVFNDSIANTPYKELTSQLKKQLSESGALQPPSRQ